MSRERVIEFLSMVDSDRNDSDVLKASQAFTKTNEAAILSVAQ
jgi:hypothetical protein